MNENTKLKEWYTTNYPSDELELKSILIRLSKISLMPSTSTGMFMRSSV